MRDEDTLNSYQALLDSDDHEYIVEAIMGHTGKNKRDVRFKIRWAGYGPEHDTVEPWDNVVGNTLIDAYIDAHPELERLRH